VLVKVPTFRADFFREETRNEELFADHQEKLISSCFDGKKDKKKLPQKCSKKYFVEVVE